MATTGLTNEVDCLAPGLLAALMRRAHYLKRSAWFCFHCPVFGGSWVSGLRMTASSIDINAVLALAIAAYLLSNPLGRSKFARSPANQTHRANLRTVRC
jgi:hypothetical protein